MRLERTLAYINTSLVLDVGANCGQFASEIRDAGYAGQIVSFEPLGDAHRILANKAANDAKWTVHQRAAVGDEAGNIEMNVSENSVSSSILKMNDVHEEAHQASRYIATEQVPVITLDDVVPDYQPPSNRSVFLKIDTQGYEWQVLNGAERTLSLCGAILLEASLVELYQGQKLWFELIERMSQNGFHVWSIDRGFFNRDTGQTLQCDAVFMHESNMPKSSN
ncbi:MAG: FkbM family methyltransferase [Rubripirellula sp.]